MSAVAAAAAAAEVAAVKDNCISYAQQQALLQCDAAKQSIYSQNSYVRILGAEFSEILLPTQCLW